MYFGGYSTGPAGRKTQLLYDPAVERRNRQPLERPVDFGAEWELRLGPENRFRVVCEIDTGQRQVRVLAIGSRKAIAFRLEGCKSRREIAATDGIPHDQVWQEASAESRSKKKRTC